MTAVIDPLSIAALDIWTELASIGFAIFLSFAVFVVSLTQVR
jgi:hypothetical protein